MKTPLSLRLGALVLAAASTYLACTPRAAAGDGAAPAGGDRGSYQLVPLAEGRWQVYLVPRPWLRAQWKGPAIKALYFALASAAAKDIDNDIGPCVAPARLVAIVTREARPPLEVPLESYDFCSPGSPANARPGWPSGPQAYVEGISVHLAGDGRVEIEQSFRQHSDEPLPLDKNPATFSRPREGKAQGSLRVVRLEELYPSIR